MRSNIRALALCFIVSVACMGGTYATASVIAIGPENFPPGTHLINFDGFNDGAHVDGYIDGILFMYYLPVEAGEVVIGHFFGATNNMTPPYANTVGDNRTVSMLLILPAPATMLGYGYALNIDRHLAEASWIKLYLNNELVGSLSYDGDRDPDFTGGFAGIQSTIPFDTVNFGFNEIASVWAFDNVMVYYAVPEPGTLMLFGTIALGLAGAIRSKTL